MALAAVEAECVGIAVPVLAKDLLMGLVLQHDQHDQASLHHLLAWGHQGAHRTLQAHESSGLAIAETTPAQAIEHTWKLI